MLFLSPFLLLPILCLVVWSTLAVRRRWTAVSFSVAMCAATLIAGFWSILQSRSSTAGIGLLFLPGVASLSALPAAAFAAWRVSTRRGMRAASLVALIASIVAPTAVVFSGFENRAKNARADRAYAEDERAIAANRVRIAALLRAQPGEEESVLSAEIAAHRHDRTVLIPALETAFVPEDMLDALSRESDLGIVLMVANNRRTRAETLEHIDRRATYPPYFFQALAANPHTPQPVLRELAHRSSENSGIAPALTHNPSTPPDVLNAIRSSR
jgi:hypothetical protein